MLHLAQSPFDTSSPPNVADACADDDHHVSAYQPVLFHALDNVDDAVLFANVSIVYVIDALFSSQLLTMPTDTCSGKFIVYVPITKPPSTRSTAPEM